MRAEIIFVFSLIILTPPLFFFFVQTGQASDREVILLTQEELKPIFSEIITENALWPEENLVVSGFSARPATMTVPTGAIEYRLINRTHSNYLGRKAITVVLMINGKEYGQVRMSGDLQLYGEVLCTNRRIKRHTVLAENDIRVIRRNISMLGPDFIKSTEMAVGLRLKSSLRAGAVLFSHQLEAPPLVKRGDLVTIQAKSENIRVTVPGEIRNPGAMGELVRVKNLMSRKEVFAKVLDSGTVEVNY
ncbi:MAG: flagellar basal body P-ring formation chaperone FlgA [Thermodesulfobacteriota bacterium]|nr:flagellar basal body P-ring formation chaperone FlgA [Thermodesulfobacteriota bacterium]